MASLKYEGNSSFQIGTLGSSYTSGGTSISLTAGHGARFPSEGDFWIRIDDEIFKVTARSTDTLTVSGAQDGTSASNHTAGVNVSWICGASALTQLKQDLDLWTLYPIASLTGQTTTLNGAINSAVTSLVVNAQFSSMPATPFFIMIDTEQIKVTAAASTTWTIVRGDGGTTAASHSDAATIYEQLYSWHDKTATASAAFNGNNLILEETATLGGGADYGTKLKIKLAYSAPWSVEIVLGSVFPYGANYTAYGVGLWADGDPTKDVRIIGNQYNSFWIGPSSIFQWSGGYATAITGGTPGAYAGQNWGYPFTPFNPVRIKWVDDNTNWLVYVDHGGGYKEYGRVARNTHITATYVGFWVSARGGHAGCAIKSFKQYNSVI